LDLYAPSQLGGYLQHFLDPGWFEGAILVDVSANDHVGVVDLLSVLIYIVLDLVDERLANISVDVVNEEVLGHLIQISTIIIA